MSNTTLARLSDRDYIGPGVWFMLHLLGAHANNSPEIAAAYPEIIELIAQTFPCEECRAHFVKGIRSLPPEKFKGLHNGYFAWSHAFHKQVNDRLDKPTPGYAAALEWFRNPVSSCESCGPSASHHVVSR